MGRFDIDPPSGGLAEQGLQLLPILDLAGQKDVLGPAAPVGGVVLPHQIGDRLAVLLQRLVHHLHVLAGQVPVHEMQHGEAGLGAPAEADGVGIGEGRGDHPLLDGHALDGPHPVPKLRGFLKAQLLRRLLHLALQIFDQFPALSLQDQHRLAHPGPVVLRAAVLQTPAGAGAHVVVQAGPLLADVPGEFAAAVRQQQSLADGVQDLPGLIAAAEGAVVFGPVLGSAAREAHHRILLSGVHPHEGIALVVLQEDVIVGLVALDEGVFQHQGLKLAAGDDDVEVRHLFHHGGHLGQMLPVEIAADPVFQLLGFAHVDDLAPGVQHDVDPGQQGQPIGFLPQGIQHVLTSRSEF